MTSMNIETITSRTAITLVHTLYPRVFADTLCSLWYRVKTYRFKLCDNSLFIAHQNEPIRFILTNCTLGSLKDFDVGLSLVGSQEILWDNLFRSTCYGTELFGIKASAAELKVSKSQQEKNNN